MSVRSSRVVQVNCDSCSATVRGSWYHNMEIASYDVCTVCYAGELATCSYTRWEVVEMEEGVVVVMEEGVVVVMVVVVHVGTSEEVGHIIICTALRQSRDTWPLQPSSTR